MTLQTIRDAAIILMVAVNIIVGLGVLVLIWQAWKLVGFVKMQGLTLTGTVAEILEHVKAAAQTTAKTAQQAEGTAEFVGDRTARPVIEFYAAIAGASRFAQAVFHRGHHEESGG